MVLPVRFSVEYLIEGTVLEGAAARRLYAVAEAQIVLRFETDVRLNLSLHPDLVEYSYDDKRLDLLIPLLSRGWIETPLRPGQNPRLLRACETGEIGVRLVTATEDRTFRASQELSSRWSSQNPERWSPPSERDRLLIQVGRDGVPSGHHGGAKVRKTREPEGGRQQVVLHGLVLPARSTCVFCDAVDPDTREHAVPAWAMRPGEAGMTVAACGRCNHALSALESDVAEISRRGSLELSSGERFLVALWAIKTIWVLGKVLGLDPLHGIGESYVSMLTGADIQVGPGTHSLGGTHISIEPSSSSRAMTLSEAAADTPWVMLQMLNVVVTVWIEPVGSED